MITLRNIRTVDGHILCEAFPEDCTVPVHMDVEAETKTLAPLVLPDGYAWCKTHIRMAKNYLLANAGSLPQVHIIMWY